MGVPSWAQPPGGLSSLGRWERLVPRALADRRGPCAHLRRRPVPPRLLRRRHRLQPTERQLRHDLHAARIRRLRLVLLAPRPMLFVPDRQGPGHGSDVELSVHPAESAAAAVPVVLAPRRPALRAALRGRLEGGHGHVPAEHRLLRCPDDLPDVRPRQGGVRQAGGARRRALALYQRRTSPAERIDGCGPRRLHAVLRRLDVLLLPPRTEDDEPQAMGRELVPTGFNHGRAASLFRENRTSVLYAVLAGLCVAVIALAWQ